MHFTGMNLTHSPDSLLSLYHPECKSDTTNKTNSKPSDVIDQRYFIFFEEELKHED